MQELKLRCVALFRRTIADFQEQLVIRTLNQEVIEAQSANVGIHSNLAEPGIHSLITEYTLNTNTVDPVYSERLSPHRSLIYSQIKYVYSEYPAQVNTFCCTDPFTINGIDCITNNSNINTHIKNELIILFYYSEILWPYLHIGDDSNFLYANHLFRGLVVL
jgi:hypothetical protein